MRILLINYEYPPFGGGAANATQEIGRALIQNGHEVSVLVGGKGPAYTDYLGIRVIRVGSSRKHQFQASKREMLEFLFLGMFWAATRREEKYNVAFAFFSLPSGPIARVLEICCGVPYGISLRGGDVPGLVPEISFIHRVLTPLRRWALRNAKAVMANSDSLADLSRASDPVEVVVIPNGIDTERYCPDTSHRVRQSGILRLIIVGRFHRQKRIPETIRCFSEAKRQGVQFLISIVGDGPEREEIRETITQEGITEEVSMKGWLDKDQLVEEYQAADCYVNFSSYEGMPNTVLEAMACGLPALASNIPPHQLLIEDGVSGALVDIDQCDQVVWWITRLFSDRRQLREMGIQARQHTLSRHSWISVAGSYLSLFGSVGNTELSRLGE